MWIWVILSVWGPTLSQEWNAPECHSQCPAFTHLLVLLAGMDPRRTTDLLLSKCILAGWLNPTVHFSWKEITLARDKIPQITLPQFKGRHPFPPPKYSLHTSFKARDRCGGLLGAKGSRGAYSPVFQSIRDSLWPKQLWAGASFF